MGGLDDGHFTDIGWRVTATHRFTSMEFFQCSKSETKGVSEADVRSSLAFVPVVEAAVEDER